MPLCPRPALSLPWAVLDRPEGYKVLAGRRLRWAERGASHSNMTLKGMLSNTSWSTVLVSVFSVCRSSYLPLAPWKFLCGLHYLNLVAHPDRAVFDNARADTTATL